MMILDIKLLHITSSFVVNEVMQGQIHMIIYCMYYHVISFISIILKVLITIIACFICCYNGNIENIICGLTLYVFVIIMFSRCEIKIYFFIIILNRRRKTFNVVMRIYIIIYLNLVLFYAVFPHWRSFTNEINNKETSRIYQLKWDLKVSGICSLVHIYMDVTNGFKISACILLF